MAGDLRIETNLFEVAVPAVSVILAALAGLISKFSRGQFIVMLWYLVCGDSHHSEVALGRSRLGDGCRLKDRKGIWVILHHAVNRHDETAFEMLSLVGLDEGRPGFYAAKFAKALREASDAPVPTHASGFLKSCKEKRE